MTRVDEQAELALVRVANSMPVPLETIRARRSQGAAFTLACNACDLEDKEIYMALGLDAGTFSRMKKGMNTLPVDLLAQFCRTVGNTIYAEWLAYQVNCTLVLIKSEAERRLEEAEQRNHELAIKVQVLQEALRGVR